MKNTLSKPVAGILGALLLLGGVQSVFAQEAPTLSVILSASPTAGYAPLTGVDLHAVVGGTATGTVSYTFYCDRVDNGTNLIGTHVAQVLGSASSSVSATDACAYTLPGTYSGKVIVERGGLLAESRVTVTVSPAPAIPTLSVAISANPASGIAPLSGVDLTASVSGTATGTINYTFYCDRADNGTNLTGSSSASFTALTATAQTAIDACSYASVGTYTGKVIVERGGLFAEARTSVSAQHTPATPPSTTTPPVMQKGEWKLEIGGAGKTLMRGHIESVTSDSIKVRTWGGVWTVRVLSGAEIIPRVSSALFDLTRFQPGDYVGVNGTIVRDAPLTIEARVIRNWTEVREVKWERKSNHDFLKRLIKDDRISDSLTGRVFEGTVGSISGSSFTLAHDGTVVTVNTSGGTKFVDKNYTTIAFASIVTGHKLRVFGDVTASSTILAAVVRDTSIPFHTPSIENFGQSKKHNEKKNDDKKKQNGKGKGGGHGNDDHDD